MLPATGVPLPFISYGGTSFLSFSILLFIFIRLDLERWK
jgi:rod shape determining protein RodA